jgi:hypothetical protein
MKTILLFFVILTAFAFTFQNNNKVTATVCGQSEGSLTKDQIINCDLLLSDTTNHSILTFTIEWFNGTDTTEMPIHNQIPDYFHDLIKEIKIGTTFYFRNIAVKDNRYDNNYTNLQFAPSLKFELVDQ